MSELTAPETLRALLKAWPDIPEVPVWFPAHDFGVVDALDKGAAAIESLGPLQARADALDADVARLNQYIAERVGNPVPASDLLRGASAERARVEALEARCKIAEADRDGWEKANRALEQAVAVRDKCREVHPLARATAGEGLTMITEAELVEMEAYCKGAEERGDYVGYTPRLIAEVRRLRGMLKDSLLVQESSLDAPLWHEHIAVLRKEFPEVDG